MSHHLPSPFDRAPCISAPGIRADLLRPAGISGRPPPFGTRGWTPLSGSTTRRRRTCGGCAGCHPWWNLTRMAAMAWAEAKVYQKEDMRGGGEEEGEEKEDLAET